jgi:AmmeMemoRadiSam system protein B
MKEIEENEHSLEVQLPFIKYLFPEAKIVPIVFCHQDLANAKLLSEYLKNIFDENTLLVISTDLSHFYNSSTAELKDNSLINLVKNKNLPMLELALKNDSIEACGFAGILTLLHLLPDKATIENITYTHSGNINGDQKRVVGYFSCGAYLNDK